MDHPSHTLKPAPKTLEPELLRAALTDVAPSAVRARVFQTVEATLAGSMALDLGKKSGVFGTASGVSGPCESAASSTEAHGGAAGGALPGCAVLSIGIPTQALTPLRIRPTPASSRSRRARWSQVLRAAQLGLALALAAGVGSAAAAHLVSSRQPLATRLALSAQGQAHQERSASSRQLAFAQAAGLRSALALSAGQPRKRNPPQRRETVRLAAAPLPAAPLGGVAPAPSPEPPDDWLGEQLSILSHADRSLRDGKPEEALKSLERYAALFPTGLLNPQVKLLRQRARREEEHQVFIFP